MSHAGHFRSECCTCGNTCGKLVSDSIHYENGTRQLSLCKILKILVRSGTTNQVTLTLTR